MQLHRHRQCEEYQQCDQSLAANITINNAINKCAIIEEQTSIIIDVLSKIR